MKKSIIALTLIAATLGISSCGVMDEVINGGTTEAEQQIYSIYEQAKADGYTGTYQEWLDSIRGEAGEKGEKGEPGAKGEAGAKGETGPAGPAGPAGAKGQDGADGSTILTGATNPTNEQGKDGDLFLNTTTWDVLAKESGAWVKKGNIKGEDGAKGEKGEAGAKGETGPAGPKGETGAKGETGPAGPQGEKGETGAAGAKGEQGEKGETGAAGQDGKSAYDIYIEAHPEEKSKYPTEQSWLDALVNGKLGTKVTHTVTFDSMGGSKVEPQTVEHGEKAFKPMNPTKEGYTFNNWTYRDEVWSFVGFPVTTDTYLKATWNANTYNVTFDAGAGTLAPEETTGTYTYDEACTLPTPVKEGDEFVGWYNPATKEMCSKNRWTIAADATVKAIYKSDNFTITFDYNNGSTPNDVVNTTFDKFISLTPAQKAPQTEGLTFKGWKNTTTGEIIKSNFWFDKVPENITLEAIWSVNARKYNFTNDKNKVYTVEFKNGTTDTVTFSTTDSTNFVASKNVDLPYTFSKGIIKFSANWSYDDYDYGTTEEGKSKIELVLDAATGNLTVNGSVNDGGGWGAVTRLSKGNVFVGEADPIVRKDMWTTEAGVYELEPGKTIKLYKGKFTTTGFSDIAGELNVSYKVENGILKGSTYVFDVYGDMVDIVIECEIASDLSTLTFKQSVGSGYTTYIDANAVVTRTSGPTRTL